MPWTAETFKKHKKGMPEGHAKKGSEMANSILKSCLAEGKSQAECERIAIATSLKHLKRNSKRITK